MTRRLVTVEVDGSVSVVRGWLAHKLALEAGLRPTFSGVCGGWMFDTKRLPDLVAHLERRRIAVEVLEDRSPSVPVEAEREVGCPAISTDVALFELDGGR